jgi:MSHA biogenesis protein MshQ
LDTITLVKPSSPPATRGSVDLSSTVGSPGFVYLPGIGRQTFGVTSAGPIIYMRERY